VHHRLTVSAVTLSLLAKAAGPLYGNWWAVADSGGSSGGFAGRALMTVGALQKQVLKGVSTLRAGGAYGLQVLLNRRFRAPGGRGRAGKIVTGSDEAGGGGDSDAAIAASGGNNDVSAVLTAAVDDDQREAAAVAKGAAALEQELQRRRAQETGSEFGEAPLAAAQAAPGPAASAVGQDSVSPRADGNTTPEGFIILPSSPYYADANAAATAAAAAAVAAAAAASAGPTGGGTVAAGPTGGGGGGKGGAGEQLLPPQELLYFFQSLDSTVIKAWGMLRDQLKRRITPLLAQCMCAPSGMDPTGAGGTDTAEDLTRGASQELALAKEGAGVLLGLGVSGVNIGLGPRMGIAVSSEGGSAGDGGTSTAIGTAAAAAATAAGVTSGGNSGSGGAGAEAMDKKHLLEGHAVVVGSAVVSKAAGEAELQSYRSWCELVGVLHSSLTTLRDAGVPKGLIAGLMQQVGGSSAVPELRKNAPWLSLLSLAFKETW
jgi:hypothetical protein